MLEERKCRVKRCLNKHHARGLCHTHYAYFMYHYNRGNYAESVKKSVNNYHKKREVRFQEVLKRTTGAG
jgi:hypothetical protein